jgi:hypothetical protein
MDNNKMDNGDIPAKVVESSDKNIFIAIQHLTKQVAENRDLVEKLKTQLEPAMNTKKAEESRVDKDEIRWCPIACHIKEAADDINYTNLLIVDILERLEI